MFEKHSDEINQSVAEIAKYNATITGSTITIVSLMLFGLNSQMVLSNNPMITMDNHLVIRSSLVI